MYGLQHKVRRVDNKPKGELGRLIAMHLDRTLPMVNPNYRGDANETMAFARSLEYFYQRFYEKEYPLNKGRLLVPTNTEVPPGVDAHTYRLIDMFGEASIVNDYADDVPIVEIGGAEYTQRVVTVANGFALSINDMEKAAYQNIPIETKKADTARAIMDRKVDALIALGDTKSQLQGFANNADVPVLTGGGDGLSGTDLHGDWLNPATTSAQIQSDIEIISRRVYLQTLGIHGTEGKRLTLVLPPSLYSGIATRRIDTFNETTVMQYVLKAIPFIGEITDWSRLINAGAPVSNVGTRRIVCYSKDPDVVEAVIPLEFEMLPMQIKGLGYRVPCRSRFGGVKWVYPKAAVYADGCGTTGQPN